MSNFPLRHVSVRVPWHDAGWAGLVCNSPQLNRNPCIRAHVHWKAGAES